MVGAGLATVLWWLVSLVLAAYAAESREFGTTYGPLTGVMALLLWANLTGIAPMSASAAQTRYGGPGWA
jgi:uncharacterized BrkB/YihY/UPF0761 family membrane protein